MVPQRRRLGLFDLHRSQFGGGEMDDAGDVHGTPVGADDEAEEGLGASNAGSMRLRCQAHIGVQLARPKTPE